MESQENKQREEATLSIWTKYGKNISFPFFVQEPPEGNAEASFYQFLYVIHACTPASPTPHMYTLQEYI